MLTDHKLSRMLWLAFVLIAGALAKADDATATLAKPVSVSEDKKPAKKMIIVEQQARSWGESHGIQVGMTLKTDLSHSFSGGVSDGGLVTHLLMEPSLTVDPEKLGGWKWKSGKFYVSMHTYNGGFLSDAVGDAQGVSNIQDAPRTYLFEAWYQHTLFGGKLRLKAGRVDANTEFAHVDNGSEFLNSSMGFSPTIFAFPTYPRPRLSANIFAEPTPHVYSNFGVYDAVGGVMPIGEAGLKWSGKTHPGRVGAGLWRFNGPVQMADGTTGRNTSGAYVVFDQTLWKQAADEGRSIGFFAQYGSADPVVNTFSMHTGAGIQWTGALRRRPADILGFGVTRVAFGDADPDCKGKNELGWEVLYKYQLRSWLSIVPDLQLVQHAGAVAGHNPVVGTMRMIAVF